jgi:hypothetical protein
VASKLLPPSQAPSFSSFAGLSDAAASHKSHHSSHHSQRSSQEPAVAGGGGEAERKASLTLPPLRDAAAACLAAEQAQEQELQQEQAGTAAAVGTAVRSTEGLRLLSSSQSHSPSRTTPLPSLEELYDRRVLGQSVDVARLLPQRRPSPALHPHLPQIRSSRTPVPPDASTAAYIAALSAAASPTKSPSKPPSQLSDKVKTLRTDQPPPQAPLLLLQPSAQAQTQPPAHVEGQAEGQGQRPVPFTPQSSVSLEER